MFITNGRGLCPISNLNIVMGRGVPVPSNCRAAVSDVTPTARPPAVRSAALIPIAFGLFVYATCPTTVPIVVLVRLPTLSLTHSVRTAFLTS